MKAAWGIAIALATLAGCGQKEDAPPKPVVAVSTARVETAAIQLTVTAPATLWARAQANIAARITAPIRELRVRKGDAVKAGQVLATLENRDLLAQRQEARAAVTDAEANLQKTSAGTLPTDVERARGQVLTAQATLNQAQKFYERRAALFREGAIPGRDLVTAETDLAQAKTSYEVAQRALDLLEHQSGERDIRMAKSRVEQARARLAAAEAQVQYTELRAPFSGVITDQFMFPGDMAKPDAPLFTVMDLSTVVARAQVPEAQAGSVRDGQACSFESPDFSGSAGGRITVVNRAVDPARRTVETWCGIPNAGVKLRAGTFGNAVIVTGAVPTATVAPVRAVQFNEGTRTGTVYVVDAQSVAHKVEVEAGQTVGGRVQILKGLKPGDVVIVEGGYGLPDNTRVEVREAK